MICDEELRGRPEVIEFGRESGERQEFNCVQRPKSNALLWDPNFREIHAAISLMKLVSGFPFERNMRCKSAFKPKLYSDGCSCVPQDSPPFL